MAWFKHEQLHQERSFVTSFIMFQVCASNAVISQPTSIFVAGVAA
jgi:hypothetical protein